MLKIGLIGLGFMGRTHLENYLRLEKEGMPIQVTAICDINPDKLEGRAAAGNIDTGSAAIDFGRFHKYTAVKDMIETERLDYVDIALPTYLHKEVTVQCLNQGLHVLCEKPMAMNADDCREMVRAAESNDRRLMIGQCLRFWPAYEYLKRTIDEQTYGAVTGGTFFRGGGTPTWGEWLLKKELSGGAMVDMHVHDTDMIHWLFGKPEFVSCMGRNVIPGSGYDVVSTHFAYPDEKVVNAQVDWTLGGDFGFEMGYRVNFEQGNLVFGKDGVLVHPNDGKGFQPELDEDLGYYRELKYFAESLLNDRPITVATPASTMGTIRIIEAEIESADKKGAWVRVRD